MAIVARRATSWYAVGMPTQAQNISVRLDHATVDMLAELVEHYDAESVAKVTASDVIRRAIQTQHADVFNR